MAVDTEIAAADAPAGKSKKKLLIIAGAGAMVVIAAGAGLYLFLSASQAPANAEAGEIVHAEPTFIFNLAPMVVNLNSEAEGPGFLRLSIALEVVDEAMMLAIQPSLAKVVDAFQVYLRELRKSDLEGSAGVYRLREELLRRVNVAIYPERVESILFKELLVQ